MVADMGGTSLRVALDQGGRLHHAARVETRALEPDAAPWLRRWLDDLPARPRAACIAVAGPVLNGEVRLTNREVSLKAVDLPVPTVLVNDLHAAAMGLDRVPRDRVLRIGGNRPDNRGPIAVLGVGTGLGEALRVHEHVLPGEGGHGAFAPVDDDTRDLHGWLLARHGNTEWEDVACGTGLGRILPWAQARAGTSPALHAALADADAQEEPPESVVLAMPDDPACALALRMMLTALGTEAGNAGLRHLSTGGVWLIGGVAARLRALLLEEDNPFNRAFEQRRGRYATIAAALPRMLVVDDDVGLYGAGVIARDLMRGG